MLSYILLGDNMDECNPITGDLLGTHLRSTIGTHIQQHYSDITTKSKRRRPVIRPRGRRDAQKTIDKFMAYPDQRFEEAFRLPKHTFFELLKWLHTNTGLSSTKHFPAQLQLLIFLWIVGHNSRQRMTSSTFDVSQSSISRSFKKLLKMFVLLCKHVVRQPDDDFLDPLVELTDPYRCFNGCIGAVDGTHIPIMIPRFEQKPYRDRKGNLSQNVFAAVGFNMEFYYVLAGAEGSINDASLQQHAAAEGFRIPPHRYYLGDAGFAFRTGYMIPYAITRYHLEDWRVHEKRPDTHKELFNWRHAQLRSIVERVFGLVKRKFAILNGTAEYSVYDQKMLVYAVAGLHNFILQSKRAKQESEESVFTREERAAHQRQLAVARRRAVLAVKDDLRETRRIIAVHLANNDSRFYR